MRLKFYFKSIFNIIGFRPNFYWRFCWKFITPGLMTVILIYNLITLKPLKDGDNEYPAIAHYIGMCISALGLIQLPAFAIYAICTQKEDTLWKVRSHVYLRRFSVFQTLCRDANVCCQRSRGLPQISISQEQKCFKITNLCHQLRTSFCRHYHVDHYKNRF